MNETLAQVNTALGIVELLRKTYCPPSFAFLEQVGDGTGYGVSRHIDAIAMGLWPSRGLHLYGFEVKVSRNDWMRELRKPDKAEPIAERMDWFYVVAPQGIVDVLTVPAKWGLAEVTTKGKLVTTKKAEKLDPKPLDHHFLAAILRQATAQSPTTMMKLEARREAREESARELESRVDLATSPIRNELETLRERVKAFEAATGIPLEQQTRTYWGWEGGEDIAKAVLYLARKGPRRILVDLEDIDRTIGRIRELTNEAREQLAEPELEPA